MRYICNTPTLNCIQDFIYFTNISPCCFVVALCSFVYLCFVVVKRILIAINKSSCRCTYNTMYMPDIISKFHEVISVAALDFSTARQILLHSNIKCGVCVRKWISRSISHATGNAVWCMSWHWELKFWISIAPPNYFILYATYDPWYKSRCWICKKLFTLSYGIFYYFDRNNPDRHDNIQKYVILCIRGLL